ncbi:Hypothetical Protein FCC1311_055042 [Hondaea fermentalgiana]|uniref:Tetraspanin n=1 Tax=Hondaea fermentalgiana TaxID=2315210 RepID=A0A2R5GEC8_9STRA|nr:Hypothetical Protein FCC1311_055042 [Hondaea fermentalgiana]|eukprot:GBG29282.1 Hypothetical Protein FCC1311_055042 [Hondaea fermentalgiana]
MWGSFLCASFITVLHCFTAIGGLVIIGLSAWLLADGFQLNVFTENDWILWIVLAVGIVILLLGCVAACKSSSTNVSCNIILAFVQAIFGLAIGAFGALIIITFVYSDQVSETAAPDLDDGISGYIKFLSDYSLGLYGSCCVPDDLPSGYDTQCGDVTSSSFDTVCYWNEDNRDFGEHNLTSSTCDSIQELDFCVLSSDWKEFQDYLASWLHDYGFPTGIAFTVYGGLLLFAFIGSCVLAVRHARAQSGDDGDGDDDGTPNALVNDGGQTINLNIDASS